MNDLIQPVLLNVNAIVCAVAAGRVFFWRLSHRPGNLIQGVVIYFIVISCAAVPARVISGEYYYTDWSETIINISLCLFCLLKGGNIFEAEVQDENQ